MRLETSSRFERHARQLPSDERRALASALRRLEADPRDPKLRTHKLSDERWACSYAYDGRIVFLWAGDLITLLDLGTHDEVY